MFAFPNIDTILTTYLEPVAIAISVTIISAFIFSFIQKRVIVRLEAFSKKTKTKIDDVVMAMVQSIHPSFYWYLAFYVGFQTLALPQIARTILNVILLALVLWYVLRASSLAIDAFLEQGKRGKKEEMTAKHLIGTFIKASLWVVAILLVLSNLGINITSLIAGLGIGGVAIAFALQNILTDLFSSFAIYFDKPFTVGDFIIVGNQMGTVERIGIKTTRLRALQGEELVISNQELTSTRIQNFHTMKERRVEMTFGILYETPRKVVAGLPEKIKGLLADIKDIRLDRVHFSGFGASSLDFDLVYYVHSGDYNEYMDKQQELNLELMELFAHEKIEFAYPTRTIYIAQQES